MPSRGTYGVNADVRATEWWVSQHWVRESCLAMTFLLVACSTWTLQTNRDWIRAFGRQPTMSWSKVIRSIQQRNEGVVVHRNFGRFPGSKGVKGNGIHPWAKQINRNWVLIPVNKEWQTQDFSAFARMCEWIESTITMDFHTIDTCVNKTKLELKRCSCGNESFLSQTEMS